MKRVLLAVVVALVLPALAIAQSNSSQKDPFTHGNAAAGAKKAQTCFACHGPNGNGSVNKAWPKLSDQNSKYIYDQLVAFKKHDRNNPLMWAQAGNLNDSDMRDLAAYFASQPFVPGIATKAVVAVAQPLYRGGSLNRHIPACAACHGPDGQGNPAVPYPRIGGQNAEYVAAQLTAFKDGKRAQTEPAKVMQAIASRLTDKEIDALASYVSGLR